MDHAAASRLLPSEFAAPPLLAERDGRETANAHGRAQAGLGPLKRAWDRGAGVSCDMPRAARTAGVSVRLAAFGALCAAAFSGLALGHWHALGHVRGQFATLAFQLCELEARLVEECPDRLQLDEREMLPAFPVATIRAHIGIASSIVPCGGLLVSAGADGLVQAWRTGHRWSSLSEYWSKSYSLAFVVDRLGEGVLSLHAAVDGSGQCAVLLAGTAGGHVHAYKVREKGGKRGVLQRQSLEAHQGAVHAIVGEGRIGGEQLVATAGADQSIAVWAVGADQLTMQLRVRVESAHRGGVRALALYNELLLSAGLDGKIGVWALSDLSPIRSVSAHRSGGVVALALSSATPRIEDVEQWPSVYSASADGELKRWRLELPVHAPRGEKASLTDVGSAILQAGGAAALLAHPHRSECVTAALIDGKTQLLCAGGVFKREAGRLRPEVEFLGGTAWSGALCQLGGSLFASASDDGSVRVWDMERARARFASRVRAQRPRAQGEDGQDRLTKSRPDGGAKEREAIQFFDDSGAHTFSNPAVADAIYLSEGAGI